ncbi:MAG: molecular chaperone DnaK, partial [Solobacterium sp.]|nr:molecular chaperone DnaK [Solobacterium sp.]
YINQIDETLKNDNANVTPEQKAEVQKLRDELQKAIDDNDMDSLKTKLDALEQAANAMAQQMYQNAGNAGAGSASSANDDVMDADFTEKK